MDLRSGWKVPAERAYALLRWTLGIDIFVHGALRLWNGPAGFVVWMVNDFAKTPLPPLLVRAFAWPLPFVEALLGALLIAGLFTRQTLTAGAFVMMLLIFGTTLQQNYATVGIQLIYAIIYFVLLTYVERDTLSLDAWRRSR